MVYDALGNVNFDQIRKGVLSEIIVMHQDKYCKSGKSGKSAKALGKSMLHTDGFFALIPSIVQTKPIDAIADQCFVDLFGFKAMATSFRNEALWQQS